MSTPDAPSDPIADVGGDAAPNPMLTALLGALGGQGAMDPLALMRTQLEGQSANPQMAQLLQLLEQRRVQSHRNDEVAEADDAATVEVAATTEAPGSLDEIGDVGDRLYTELETLRERSADLAAALGACRLCFGDDASCRLCGGRGEAGSRAPRPEAFRRYVIPAVRRAREIEGAPSLAGDRDRPTRPLTARSARHLEPQFDQTTIERQVAP